MMGDVVENRRDALRVVGLMKDEVVEGAKDLLTKVDVKGVEREEESRGAAAR